jgi:hypothetical protein
MRKPRSQRIILWLIFGTILLHLYGMKGFGVFVGLSLLIVLIDRYAAAILPPRVSTRVVILCLVIVSITTVSGMILVALLRGADAFSDMPEWTYFLLVLGFVLPATVAAILSTCPSRTPQQPSSPGRAA